MKISEALGEMPIADEAATVGLAEVAKVADQGVFLRQLVTFASQYVDASTYVECSRYYILTDCVVTFDSLPG